MIDFSDRSEVIDINKKHYRNKVYAQIAKQDDKEKSKGSSPSKHDVRKSALRKMYQIRCRTQMSRKEQFASDLKSEVESRLVMENLQKKIN